MATASRDRTVRLWDRKGKLIRTLQHEKAVLDLEFAPNPAEPTLVTTTGAGTVHIWGLDDRSHTVLETPGRERVAISNDGEYRGGLRRGQDCAGVRRAERSSPVRAPAREPGAERRLRPAEGVVGDGERQEDRAGTWDLRQGRNTHTFDGFFGRVVDVAVSPEGQFVGTASSDGTARIFDIAVKRGELIAIPTGHREQLHTIEFSPGGLYILTSSRDGTARVWKTDRGNEIAVLAGHDGDVRGASFSRTGRRVLTYSEDGTARIWDSGTAPELGQVSREKASLTGLDVADDGRVRVTTNANGVARVWSPGRGKEPVVLPIRGVRDAQLSPSGNSVAIAAGDRFARTWSTEGVPGLEFPTRDRVNVVAFSPDGRVLATAGPKGVMLWNLRENGRFERLIEAGPDTVDLSFSPDGKRLVTAGSDGVGRIWNVDTGGLEQDLLGHTDRLTSAEFSPNGKLVVTASADRDAIVWDAQTGQRRKRLRGHGAMRERCCFQLRRTLDRDRRAGPSRPVGGPDR